MFDSHTRHIIKLILLLLVVVTSFITQAQNNIYVQVSDSVSGEPIPYAAIKVVNTLSGTLTDENGFATITTREREPLLNVSIMGYRTKVTRVSGPNLNNILLVPTTIELNEIIVTQGHEHYSKRNNKAVELMEKVRAAGKQKQPEQLPYYTYNKYEKITLAINDFKNLITDTSSNNFSFLSEYADTSRITGKPILNISIKEKLSTIYHKSTPNITKEVITAIRRNGVDQIADQASIQTFLEDVLRSINIYDNDINILQNRFVSPLSNIAPSFYKFYITDTIGIDNNKTIELSFVPRVSSTFGFTGKFFIAYGDSTYLIKSAILSVPSRINLNFVKNLVITQKYNVAPNGSQIKESDDMTLELSLLSSLKGLYVHRHTNNYDHSFPEQISNDIFDSMSNTITLHGASKHNETFWAQNRPTPISQGESRINEMIESLRSRPLYYWSEKFLKIIVNGYVVTSTPDSKFDIGPVNTLISTNDIEGIRLRLGGMTTANLSPRLFGRGYIAYGTRDHVFKYRGELEYSFADKEYHSREFPVHSLRFTHLYDVNMIGQQYLFTNPDNIFLSLKRMKNRLMTYHRISELKYTLELQNNLSVEANLRHERQEATRYVPFRTVSGTEYGHYNETTLGITLRYAPGEKFYQTKTYRVAVNMDAPIFILSYIYGPKKIFGNMFSINRAETSVQKRFWFSAFGYFDCMIKGGYIWSSTPYPSLILPNANLSYTIQPESFALMNPLEFISDRYISCDFTYWANGAILNYIPLIKKLKLREVFGLRGYLGSLSNKNRPTYLNSLFEFPEQSLTTTMHGRPYFEATVGLDNIFKCLRLDYVWRLNYRTTPGVDKHGIRIAFHVTF